MAGDLPVIIGETRFLRIADETTWGVTPGSPTFFDVPCNDYTVRLKPKRRDGTARTGSFQPRFGVNVSGHPSGNLVTPLYGWHPNSMTTSLAQYLMEWGFLDQEAQFPRSKLAQWVCVGHQDDKQHNGLRVNTITLAGSDAGIILTVELIGGTETILSAQTMTPPTTRNKLGEFLFEDSIVSLNGSPVNVSAWQWQAQRNLDPIYLNSRVPTSLPKTQWKETFTVTPLKADSSWDVMRDAFGMQEIAGQLTVKGMHNGTGTALTNFTQLVTAFARLSLVDSDESGGAGALMNPLTFNVLKPDTSSNGSVMTWSDVA